MQVSQCSSRVRALHSFVGGAVAASGAGGTFVAGGTTTGSGVGTAGIAGGVHEGASGSGAPVMAGGASADGNAPFVLPAADSHAMVHSTSGKPSSRTLVQPWGQSLSASRFARRVMRSSGEAVSAGTVSV